MKKQVWTLLVVVALMATLVLSACGGAAAPAAEAPAADAPAAEAPAADAPAADEVKMVGISMPTKSSARWVADGDNMVKVFEAAGYDTDLQYAEDDIPNQLAQIENMVTKDAKVLVIAAIDGTTLSAVLQKAHDAGVKVIAYDRLIRDSGQCRLLHHLRQLPGRRAPGQESSKGLGLRTPPGPFNIELFGGSPDDNNAFFFYDGAMSVLQPLIDKGKLVVKSARPAWRRSARCAGTGHCPGPHGQHAVSRLLGRQPRRRRALALRRPVARHHLVAAGVGYGTADQPWPIVTGQDAEIPSIKAIIAGEQYSTVFKDTRELAKVTAKMVDAALSGQVPRSTTPRPTTTASRSSRPTCWSRYGRRPTGQNALVDSGYYTEDQ
jgi:putative multiple sugar transport system substrate-binding protein